MQPAQENSMSFAYVIGAADGPQKIGIAKNPELRRKHLQCAQHRELKISYAVELPRWLAERVEKYAHRMNVRRRVSGEWFEMSAQEAESEIKKAIEDLLNGKPMPPKPRDDLVMTPTRLRECLALLRWSQRGLAEALHRQEGTVRQWARGVVRVPDDVAAWLEAVAPQAGVLHDALDRLLKENPPPLRNRVD